MTKEEFLKESSKYYTIQAYYINLVHVKFR